ncbi:MAG: hypothetical protein LBF97_00810 [Elusimicrobiota bacterium]|jgi:predicted CoA-binding protein|nr:hypothetical protein [Elusimicrobiota bacterium]
MLKYNSIFTIFFLNPILIILILIFILILILILIRSLVSWYLKINKILESQKIIFDKLDEIEKKFNKLCNESVNTELSTKKLNNLENINKNLYTEKKENVINNEKDIIKEMFQNSKNIVFYEANNNLENQNIYTYFRAKQYNVILVSIEIENFKNYDSLISIEERLDLIVFVEMNKNLEETKEKLDKLVKECIARKKIKSDLKYIWIEDFLDNYENILSIDSLNELGIEVVIGRNFYNEYVKKILKKVF